MENLINEISKEKGIELSLSQMTLGRFIKELEALPQDVEIENINGPHSYRGKASDLAFKKVKGVQTIESLLNTCKQCLNETYIGYKGGSFYMDANTPLWIAEYGSFNGLKIMEIIEGDVFSLSTQSYD